MGEVIAGRYEVKGVLGEGGTGIVYDAIRTDDGKAVALKVMHAELAGDRQIRGRFQREAAILRRLEGPHICPILDHGEVPGGDEKGAIVYLALPKLEGPSLERVLQEEGPLPVDRVLDIVLDVLVALKAAHAQGIIHRDLKPANVILDGGSRVVVVDFGMAKIVTGTGTGTTNLTAHNMLFGTPEYMSPEQARGDDLDARCDVYAVGVMLYEMLTGARPFEGPTPLSVLTAHLTSELVPPSARAPEGRLSAALESVVLNALARDRDRRYPTAAALSAAIRHARVAPDDVTSLRPEAFTAAPPGTDAFAATMPAFSDAPTLPSLGPLVPPPTPSEPPLAAPAASAGPKRASTSASGEIRVDRAASGPPVRVTPVSPSRSPGRASGSLPPSSTGTRGRSSAPSGAPVARDPSQRKWIVAWIVVAFVSIGAGVFLALR